MTELSLQYPDNPYVNGVAQSNRIVTLSEDQSNAIQFINDFMKSGNRYAVIGGYAGTGKSSIIPFVQNSIPNIIVCAYTGKAVMVLKRKGVNAQTLHSFLYDTKIVSDPEDPHPKYVFVEKEEYCFLGINLLIVDEASMVPEEMFNLISKHHFKTIYIGDHFQLPPINSTGFNIMANPNFKMEKILRQNEGNPIVELATMARNRINIPEGIYESKEYGSSVCTSEFNTDSLNDYDEIIVWTNAMKDRINDKCRELMNRPYGIPVDSDKMIVKSNCRDRMLFNGQIVYLAGNPKKLRSGAWDVTMIDEIVKDNVFMLVMTNSALHAKASVHLDKATLDRITSLPRSSKEKSKYEVHLDWGYAITCHAAQGSSWKNVAVVLENRMRYVTDCYWQWLYTAITRAEESVTILKVNKDTKI